MFNLSKDSELSPAEVTEKAAGFFGAPGIGLAMTRLPDGLRFDGGGGHVIISVTPGEQATQVSVVGMEWEFQAREFLDQV